MKRLALLTLALLATPVWAQNQPLIEEGRKLAVRHCAGCHAVSDGQSPLPEAPAFSDLSKRFPLERFTEAYDDGLFSGHPRMPLVQLDPDELTALSAFLASLAPKPREGEAIS